MTARRFRYNVTRAAYHKEWGNRYEEPGVGAHILAFVFRLLPKIGPLRALAFKVPTPQAETKLMRSFNDALARLRSAASELQGGLRLTNTNFDIGAPERQGEYRMADEAYANLLDLYADKQVHPSDTMRANILAYFQDPLRITDPKALTELNVLKSTPSSPSQ